LSADEALLVSRARDGDAAAFGQLVETYEKRVFNLAYRMCGNREDAADLAQEALVRAYKAMKRFREQAQFSTWLYRIVVNVCLDHQRSRLRHPTVSLDEPVSGEDGDIPRQIEANVLDPSAEYERTETQEAVHRAIGQLNEEHRAVVVLRDIQGLAYEEIAESLGVALGTVKSRLNRARMALRDELREAELLTPPSVYAGSRGGSRGEGHA
jgi:RNA polymerase sigma-70 factor, ECF subfamily